MFDLKDCPMCEIENAKIYQEAPHDTFIVDCPRCRKFTLQDTVFDDDFHSLTDIDRAKLSGWSYKQNKMGLKADITKSNFNEIKKIQIPSIPERIRSFLNLAVKKLPVYRQKANYWDPEFQAICYSTHQDDMTMIVKYLSDRGLITSGSGVFYIMPDGYIQNEEWNLISQDSKQGFVAMWFDDKMDDVWENGFKPAIEEAGYEAFKVDMKHHNNKIDDEIIASIKRSKFLVADFTGQRGGVYFEAGYAMGKGLPVFWTCRKSDMGDLHFDIRQFNCIGWESAEDLANRLETRIEAVMGKG
ncbi:MAG: hypothetical protein IH901_04890, partial [Proteobacteria bacterium]|nr:hypothetical protein [Pseudomonadota bacterium]